MKSRKTLKHQQLVAETIDQLKARFQPRVPDVKKAIDAMIDREYIEREEGTRDSYRCVLRSSLAREVVGERRADRMRLFCGDTDTSHERVIPCSAQKFSPLGLSYQHTRRPASMPDSAGIVATPSLLAWAPSDDDPSAWRLPDVAHDVCPCISLSHPRLVVYGCPAAVPPGSSLFPPRLALLASPV